jgi:hypothetical protein
MFYLLHFANNPKKFTRARTPAHTHPQIHAHPDKTPAPSRAPVPPARTESPENAC